jgi:hypothetical protein
MYNIPQEILQLIHEHTALANEYRILAEELKEEVSELKLKLEKYEQTTKPGQDQCQDEKESSSN